MPQYLVRLAQAHESFRKVELQALADIAGVALHFVRYEEDVSLARHPLYDSMLHISLFLTGPLLRIAFVLLDHILTVEVTLLHCRTTIRCRSAKGHCPKHL